MCRREADAAMDSSDYLRQLRTHADEAVDMAVENVMTQDEKLQFNYLLKKLHSALKTPSQKKKKQEGKEHRIPAAKDLFEENVMSQIRRNIKKFEGQQNRSIDLNWDLNLKFVEEFTDAKLISLDKIKATHQVIIEQENMTSNIHLLTAYYRGLSYIFARKYVTGPVKNWFRKEFNVCYAKVHRYENLAILIKSYPGLLVCGLTLNQFYKHRERLLTYLEKDPELSKQLRTEVDVMVQGCDAEVKPLTIDIIPSTTIKHTTDPDQVYESDDWYESAEEEEGNIDTISKLVHKEAEEARVELLSLETTQKMTV